MIKIKRIYDKPEKSDGFRILVDRLWPRGLSKNKAKVDLCLKDIAPSDKLSKWFSHDVKKWSEFQKKYKQELKAKAVLINKIKTLQEENKTVTLLFSAKDTLHNNTVVLQSILSSPQ